MILSRTTISYSYNLNKTTIYVAPHCSMEIPPLEYRGDVCLQFDYHGYGSTDLETLNVMVNRDSLLWSNDLIDSSLLWQRVYVDFQWKDNAHLTFSSTSGHMSTGILAIDEIYITSGRCDGW